MLRLGIVDFDSSHSIEFTRRFNHVGVSSDQFVEGARVVMGCPGRSEMAPERIDTYRPLVAACGVELVDDPEQLIGQVDGVLILSLCGSAHLGRARPFIERRIPVFIDKPLVNAARDAAELLRLSRQHESVVWTASGMRLSDDVHHLKSRLDVLGPVLGLVSHGPGWRHQGNPGLLHYGIHAVEQAYALMGPGCLQVSCRGGDMGDEVTGLWADGRIVTVRLQRQGSTAYGLLTFHERGVLHTPTSTRNSYRNLCSAIVGSFTNKAAAVPLGESIEVIHFMLAALASERSGGVPIALALPPTD